MESKNVLVTGAEGFIGTHVTRELKKRGYNLVSEIDSGVPLYGLIHLAGLAGIRPPNQNPEEHFEKNARDTKFILDILELCNMRPRMVLASTSAVYGIPNSVPVDETFNADDAICPYGVSKRAAEMFCENHSITTGMNIAVLRLATVYGEGQKSEMAIPVITNRIYRGQEVTVQAKGNTVRDYVHVSDVVNAIILAMELSIGYQVYNIGSGAPRMLSEVIRLIAFRLGKKPILHYVPLGDGEPLSIYGTSAKAISVLGYAPKVELSEGLDKFVYWYLKVNKDAAADAFRLRRQRNRRSKDIFLVEGRSH